MVTGASGFVGRQVVQQLKTAGHEVVKLGRSAAPDIVMWDVKNGQLDPNALNGVTAIIHLAGASVAGPRWTQPRKAEIMSSRVDSAALLLKAVTKAGLKLDAFVSASGVGVYKQHKGEAPLVRENDAAGSDFLAQVCVQWERAATNFSNVASRVAVMRLGVVLGQDGGALPLLQKQVRWGVAAAIGTGEQPMPWIHVDDAAAAFCWAVEKPVNGTFNVVASEVPTNRYFTQTLCKAHGKKLRWPNVPSAILRLALGEQARIVTHGCRPANDKLLKAGFVMRHRQLERALSA